MILVPVSIIIGVLVWLLVQHHRYVSQEIK